MEELFTMQGAVLKELLLMRYKQLKTFDEKERKMPKRSENAVIKNNASHLLH